MLSGQEGSNKISPLPGVVTNSSRLDALEQKLAGVYNLGGKLIAVEHMAAEMDIDIPDVEVGFVCQIAGSWLSSQHLWRGLLGLLFSA